MQVFTVKISADYKVTEKEIKEAIWQRGLMDREQIEVTLN